MASQSGVTYIGVTNDLSRRIREHKQGLLEGFTKKYQCKKLVFYEPTTNVHDALEREKQLKRWRRAKKSALIQMDNPRWQDLADEVDASL